MTLAQFDQWITDNYETLAKEVGKKYPSLKKSVRSDLNDFYYFVVEGEKYNDIRNIKSYAYTFIYNRNFVFFNNTLGYKFPDCTKVGKMFVSLDLFMRNMGENYDDELFDFFILPGNRQYLESEDELEKKLSEEYYYEVIDRIVSKLPLDKKRLYEMYFEQGLSYRAIGKKLGVTHTSVYFYMKELLKVVKNAYIEETGEVTTPFLS